ncbi:MAG: hypothetical protein H6703_16815 [Myxococcales bacterium]|nr:hypothetical protein [Myxococcales bacterium]
MTTQAERLAGFEATLAAASAQAAEGLAERLAAHAATLGERLDAVGGFVRGAAELLGAGSVELSALAQMFAEAIDGYRAANERWITTLGELEGTLGRAGEDHTGRLVGEYLDQTREVFGDALRFQRELFTELRALRGEVEPPRGEAAAGEVAP